MEALNFVGTELEDAKPVLYFDGIEYFATGLFGCHFFDSFVRNFAERDEFGFHLLLEGSGAFHDAGAFVADNKHIF
jgi:hypothetical protein